MHFVTLISGYKKKVEMIYFRIRKFCFGCMWPNCTRI